MLEMKTSGALHNWNGDDGFPSLEGQQWHKEKLGIIRDYLTQYAKRLDNRNRSLVYLDIGAGPGLLQLDQHYLPGTPLIALDSKIRFDRYILCERDTKYAQALKVRTNKYFAGENVLILEGDINNTVEKLPQFIPLQDKNSKVSVFCLVDVYSFDVHFDTITWLAELGVDFLFINALPFNEYQNHQLYLNEEREVLNLHMGIPWSQVEDGQEANTDVLFYMSVVKAMEKRMKSLGYHVATMLHRYPDEQAVPFFQSAYCTKNKTLSTLKTEVVRAQHVQTSLFPSEG